MFGWTALERRWRDALLAAAIPAPAHGRRPGLGALDLSSFWPRFERSAPLELRLGFRAAVWALALAPPLFAGRLATFPSLAPAEQDALLRRVAGDRVFLVRQLALALKVVACFAYFGDPRVRADVDRGAGARVGPREEV